MNVGIELRPFGEHLVEFVLTEHGAKRGLGQHVGRRDELFHGDDGLLGIDDVKVQDRIDFHRDVIARYEKLARNLHNDRPQIDSDHLLNGRDQKERSRAAHVGETAEREDDGSLVLP